MRRIARLGIMLAAGAGAAPAPAETGAGPCASDVTVRGVTSLRAVFEASVRGPTGPVDKTFVVLLDTEPDLLQGLGDTLQASRILRERLPKSCRVGVRKFGTSRVRWVSGAEDLARELAPRVAGPAKPGDRGTPAPPDALREIRETLGGVLDSAQPSTLLLVCRRAAAFASHIPETERAVRSSGVRVVVAAPEAILAVPPMDSMHGGVLYDRVRIRGRDIAAYSESQRPEMPVYS